MSRNIQMVFRSAIQNFEKWMGNPRFWVVFLLLFGKIYSMLAEFNDLAVRLGMKNTVWFLPLLISDRFVEFYLLLGIVVIFCDAPFIDRLQPYVIIRIGKVRWALGQILYIMLAGIVYVAALQLIIIISVLPTVCFSGEWGSIFYTVSQISVDGFSYGFDSGYGIISTYSPISATLLTAFLLWMEGVFLGTLMFYANMRFGRTAGTAIGCFFTTMFLMIKSFIENVPVLWKIIPTIWMEISDLCTKKVGTHPGIGYAVTGLTLLIVVLSIASVRVMQKEPIEVLEQI